MSSDGGDAACWIDRTCPECGFLADGPVAPTCPRCGRDRRQDVEVGDDAGVVGRVDPVPGGDAEQGYPRADAPAPDVVEPSVGEDRG